MKTAHVSVWSNQTLPSTGNLLSTPISLNQTFGYAAQISWTGTPTGTFSVQASCDEGVISSAGVVSGVLNWTTISSTSTAVSGTAGTALYDIADAMYLWFRISYVATSGTGVAIANVNIKGV